MHQSSDWNNLPQKVKEKLMQDHLGSGLANPKGYEIDQMLNKLRSNPSRFNYSSNEKANDSWNKGGCGHGDIPL
jgi:hypothetical protein